MPCSCMGHTMEEIRDMISENNYSNFEEFQNGTFIGSACGHCLDDVRRLFEMKDD